MAKTKAAKKAVKKATKRTAKKAARKTTKRTAKKTARRARKRALVRTPSGSYFATRDDQGQFVELDEVGRSLAADRRQQAETIVGPGYGDRGDQPARPRKQTAKKR